MEKINQKTEFSARLILIFSMAFSTFGWGTHSLFTQDYTSGPIHLHPTQMDLFEDNEISQAGARHYENPVTCSFNLSQKYLLNTSTQEPITGCLRILWEIQLKGRESKEDTVIGGLEVNIKTELSDDEPGPASFSLFIVRFDICGSHQRKGYGTASLRVFLDGIKDDPLFKDTRLDMGLDYYEDEPWLERFYNKFGFKRPFGVKIPRMEMTLLNPL